MKILMTGSHGFIGTNLIEALSDEHQIVRWDIKLNDILPDCDAVIHLAGKAHDTKNTTKEEDYFKVNTKQTQTIFDAFLKSSAKKFIFFSSIKAQDNDTPYARSKRQAEEYINDVLSTREDVRYEKKIYILRPCMIHGKGVKGNLPLLFKFVKKGWPWPLVAFDNLRSYASMENVSFVVDEILKQNVESGTYNLCDDEPVSTNDLIRLMSKSLGCGTMMLHVPKSIVRLGTKIGDILHLPLNTERLRKLTENYIVDNSEIKSALGICELPVKAMDGLNATIRGLM